MDVIRGLLLDKLPKISLMDFLNKINSENKLFSVLEEIFNNADERGEINKSKLTKNMKNFAVILIVNAVLSGDFNEEVATQMINNIFMPVYRHTLVM